MKQQQCGLAVKTQDWMLRVLSVCQVIDIIGKTKYYSVAQKQKKAPYGTTVPVPVNGGTR